MMKDNKYQMSMEAIKDTMDALDYLAKENGNPKDGIEILEDTSSIVLDISATLRILRFQIKCWIKVRARTVQRKTTNFIKGMLKINRR